MLITENIHEHFAMAKGRLFTVGKVHAILRQCSVNTHKSTDGKSPAVWKLRGRILIPPIELGTCCSNLSLTVSRPQPGHLGWKGSPSHNCAAVP